MFDAAQPEAVRAAARYGGGGIAALAGSALCLYIGVPEMKVGGDLRFLAIIPAMLLLVVAYGAFIQAAWSMCRGFLRDGDVELSSPCLWTIAAWTAAHVALPFWGADFRLDFTNYAANHGWYVGSLFIVGIIAYLVFSSGLKDSKRPAEFKALWGILNPRRPPAFSSEAI